MKNVLKRPIRNTTTTGAKLTKSVGLKETKAVKVMVLVEAAHKAMEEGAMETETTLETSGVLPRVVNLKYAGSEEKLMFTVGRLPRMASHVDGTKLILASFIPMPCLIVVGV